ncbi:ATP-dependent DNA helicase PcrA [Abditibacteriota bacterium]|nr:ATP-dependent DNA helicase PcrA [Abditibacteriota bacterium]
MNLLEGLNAPQQQAVTHTHGPLLIFAGAGSGKTRTLTHRIAYLIEGGVSPHRILAVTFTNKAAKEMRARLENLVGPVARRMWMGTFHALCAQMLRIHGDRIGINPRFSILDSDDQLRLMKEVVKDANLDSDRFKPAVALSKVSDAKNALIRPEKAIEKANKAHEKVYANLYARYQERLRIASALDFDDLLMEAVRLLDESPESLDHWAERFQHVLIDEFQDVNEAQFRWARLLASKHNNICVVGDDDQCLTAGTLVETPNGKKPIEAIAEGDSVLAGVGEGIARFYEVASVKSKPYQGTVLKITTDFNHELRVTPNHVCFGAIGRDRTKALRQPETILLSAFYCLGENLEPLHMVESYSRGGEYESKLDCAEERAQQTARAEGGHEIERLAMFCCMDYYPESVPFNFLPASALQINNGVPAVENNRVFSARIKRIEEEHYEGLVYDLDVPRARNFAANGVLVHNSIYAWRGANVKIILEFEQVYKDATVVRLEQNYRSTQNILDAAHGVISQNNGRAAKRLWTEEQGGAQLTLHGALNAQEEAAYVVRQIEILRREDHLDYKDFAILCRVNAQSRPFEEAFLRSRVPLKLVGTQRFYERREIRDVMAYLRWIYNPDDNAAISRLINVPPRGIGAATVDKLDSIAREQNRSMGAVLLDNGTTGKLLSPTVARKIEPLQRLLRHLMEDAQKSLNLADLMDKILERTRMLEWLRGERDGDSVDREANVEELVRAVESFDMRLAEDVDENGETSEIWNEGDPLRLGMFLGEVVLDGSGDKDNQKNQTDDAVTFMTLHSAKGLEFPVVFLAGVEQGLLPHARAVFSENASAEELEEERRLMYVGLTRAEKRAYLTFAQQRTMHGRTETTQQSQFLEEIPTHLVEREGLAKMGRGGFQTRASEWGNAGRGSYRDRIQSLPRPAFSTPSSSPSSSTSRESNGKAPQFKVSDRVRHKTYGDGLVVAASTQGGSGEWVEVAFLNGSVGKKKLIVAFAGLERADG